MLTENEFKVLEAIVKDDHQDGFPVVGHSIWTITSEDTGLESKIHSGSVSSCVKKNYVVVEQDICYITQLGYDAYLQRKDSK